MFQAIEITNSHGQKAELNDAVFSTQIPDAMLIPNLGVTANSQDFVPPSQDRFLLTPAAYTVAGTVYGGLPWRIACSPIQADKAGAPGDHRR